MDATPFGNDVSRLLDAQRDALAQAVTDRHFELDPELDRRYGPIGRAKCHQDNLFHLSYLSESIAASLPSLFADYVAWAKVMLAGRGIPASDLARNLEILGGALAAKLPPEAAAVAVSYIDDALRRLPSAPVEPESLLAHDAPLGDLAERFIGLLLAGERHMASALVLDAVASGTSVRDIYLNIFQPSQHEIGRLWQLNRISVAQEHYCTAATQLIMSQLYPHIFAGPKIGRALVATCVSGDLHEIGVRMVSDFFEMEGWDTYYLGANVPADSVVRSLVDRRAQVLAVSATISAHVSAVARLIAAVRANPVTKYVKVLVGGYPFNVESELWQQVGADGCARDAEEAVAIANRLVGEGAI